MFERWLSTPEDRLRAALFIAAIPVLAAAAALYLLRDEDRLWSL